MILSLPAANRRLLLALWIGLSCLLLLARNTQASHLRAGDIQAKVDTTAGRNPRRIFFKMILYTDNAPSSVRQPTATIFFGDGTSSGVDAIKRSTADPIRVSNTTDLNIYYFEHTYNAVGTYTVSFIGENRNRDILNIPDSFNRSFYISTTIVIDPALGFNRAPILTAPAIDRAGRNQVFLHNPAAFDADGDSLSFQLVRCQYVPEGIEGTASPTGNNRPNNQVCPGYTFPDDPAFGGTSVLYNGPPSDPGGNAVRFSQDVRTGQIVWNAPFRLGYYNAAFVVSEWRRVAGAPARRIGQVIRDMQIIVENNENLRPLLKIPNDTCVVAGTTVTRTITATDPDRNPVTIFAYSGIIPPATFRQTAAGPPTARGTFTWTPNCNNIASEPTQIVFKAQDTPTSGSPLIDERGWRITVIGPAPTGLTAQQNATIPPSVTLRWNRYLADCVGRDGIQLLIFRKEGCTNFTPSACETGLPASLGYVQVGSVAKDTQQFTDTQGLERGKSYSYRIYATFPLPGGGASLASQEVCVPIQGKSALLKNVTVDQTSTTAGAITVRWTAPKTGPNIPGGFPTPNSYRLSRAVGQGTTNFTSVFTTSNLADTSYVDTGLNTQSNAYTYRLEFFVGGIPGQAGVQSESTQPASSVRLTAVANQTATQVNLTWTYAVPWTNAGRPTLVFRRNPGSNTFVQIASVTGGATGGSYVDQGSATAPLQKGETYCYYVQTEGGYGLPGNSYLNTLINLSQQQCVVLAAIPCPPVLRLVNNCDSLNAVVSSRSGVFPRPGETYTNFLRWTLDTNAPAGCVTDIAYYRIFSRAANETQMSLRDSTRTPGVTSYDDKGLLSQAVCYQVQAVDVRGQRSALSAEVCADNCQLFVLPNIFTPNGDGINDTFRPKV
ncbi:gliding motility-associated C-terminal domain-containing protein, partial [Hymenobacter crusticola]|uniref:gliding motility-associated C-terminal domain-containing protein n=1 Tax=Hymenobacter crusticola TaxID=1770526 RepID=UPI00117B9471